MNTCTNVVGCLALALLGVLAVASRAAAQGFWTVTGAGVTANTRAEADDPTDTTPPCVDADAAGLWLPGLLGSDIGVTCGSDCDYRTPQPACELNARGGGHVRADGVGSSALRVRWKFAASTFHSCDRNVYFGTGESVFAASLNLDAAGVVPGTPVTVLYAWRGLSATTHNPEAGIDDNARMRTARMTIATGEQTGGFFDIPAGTIIRNRENQTGTFTFIAGSPWTFSVGADCFADISAPGRGAFSQDETSAMFTGELLLVIDTGGTPPPSFPLPSAVYKEFGVDLGSDREIGDANLDNNGAFDPGDAYAWNGPVVPPPGVNGVRDDQQILLGADPSPAPLAPLGPPYCSNAPLPLPPIWFDADDFDSVEFSLVPLLAAGPLPAPVALTAGCIHGVDELLVSYEDDAQFPLTFNGGPGVGCDIPCFMADAQGGVHGSVVNRDEVIALSLLQTAPLSWNIAQEFGIAHEAEVHVSMGPSPAGPLTTDDDDVDGLDAADTSGQCRVWFVSPDHETSQIDPVSGTALDPGSVYEVTPSGPVGVVTPAHLGLSVGVDVRGFEFVNMNDPASGTTGALGVLFSVADDDPLTAVDESAGLSPRMIHASFLNGSSFPLFAPGSQARGSIDAIAAYRVPLYPPTTVPPRPPCVGDLNGDFVVNTVDLVMFLARFGTPGGPPAGGGADPDFNQDGVVNILDLVIFLGAFTRPCP